MTGWRSIFAGLSKQASGFRTSQKWSIALIAFLLLILLFRSDVVYHSALSLLLSLASVVLHPLDAWEHFHAESVKYWVAMSAWCFGLILSVRALLPGKKQAVGKRGYFGLWAHFEMNKKPTTEFQLSLVALAGFVVLSLMGPFIAPLKPDEQGELSTTRFAVPFSRATCWASIPNDNASGESSDRLLRALDNVNLRLLGGKTLFTCGSTIPAGVVQPDDSYSLVLLFGTDELGRDIFSRVVEGARVSLGIGMIVALASVFLGSLLGFLSGMLGKIVDSVISRAIDVVLIIPPLFLIIAVLSFLGSPVWIVILVLALTGWMGVARLVRAEVLKLRGSEFVLNAHMMGVSTPGIIKNHFLPNVFPTIMTAAVLQLVNAILGESALSFLGLGVQPPTASWGNMLGESTAYLGTAWWIGIFPGLALMLLVVAVQIASRSFMDIRENQ